MLLRALAALFFTTSCWCIMLKPSLYLILDKVQYRGYIELCCIASLHLRSNCGMAVRGSILYMCVHPNVFQFVHIKIPPGWLRRSHMAQYHWGYFSWSTIDGMLQLLHARYSCHSRCDAGYPHSTSNGTLTSNSSLSVQCHVRPVLPVRGIWLCRYLCSYVYVLWRGKTLALPYTPWSYRIRAKVLAGVGVTARVKS